MTQLSNLKQDLETLSNSNVDFLKFNENGETHEKVYTPFPYNIFISNI